jgi:hypothetical protein
MDILKFTNIVPEKTARGVTRNPGMSNLPPRAVSFAVSGLTAAIWYCGMPAAVVVASTAIYGGI